MRIRFSIVAILSLMMSLIMVRPSQAELYSQSAPATQATDTEVLESGPTADFVIKNNLLAVLNLARFNNSDESIFKCVANSCSASGSKNPSVCDKDFVGDKQLADKLICQAVDSPTTENRRIFLDAFPKEDFPEPNFVKFLALIKASSGNSAACQKIVKDFAGQYGKGWKKDWLIVMSGCRIISKERTVKDEEDDYMTWKDVPFKLKNCDDIVNVEMQAACYAGVEAP